MKLNDMQSHSVSQGITTKFKVRDFLKFKLYIDFMYTSVWLYHNMIKALSYTVIFYLGRLTSL